MHHGDLVVGDTDRRFTLTNDMLHHDVAHPPYEGMEFGARPAMVLRAARWWPRRDAARSRAASRPSRRAR